MRRLILLFLLPVLLTGCKKETTEKVNENPNLNKCMVSLIEGKVFLTNETESDMVQLSVGDLLKENDIIKTGDDGSVELQIGKGSVIRVKEKSSVKVSKLFKDNEIQSTSLFLKSGKVLAEPEKVSEGSSFEIQTSTITAGVRGTEFVVIADDNFSKVAVKTGSVKIKKNIEIAEFDKLKELSPELAIKLEEAVNQEVVITADEKAVISQDEVSQLRKNVTESVSLIVVELEKVSDPKYMEQLVKKVEKEQISEISANMSKAVQKGDISFEEWNTDFNKMEFDQIEVKHEESKTEIESTTTTTEQVVESTSTTSTTVEAKVEEPKKELVYMAKKTGNLGVVLTEVKTGITGTSRSILIASNSNKSLISADPFTGKVQWTFTNPKLNAIQMTPLSKKNTTIIANFSAVMAVDSNGALVTSKDITNGPSFGASPVNLGSSAFIPSSRMIYEFDGSTIRDVVNIPESKGQTYLSAQGTSLFVADSLDGVIYEYSPSEDKVVWTSEKMNDTFFTAPVISGKYLLIAGTTTLFRFNYSEKSTAFESVPLGIGVMSNMVVKGGNVYFVATNGSFYKLNAASMGLSRILKVDSSLDKGGKDKLLYKQSVVSGSNIFYAADNGSLFRYDTATAQNEMIKVSSQPLVGSPVIIGKEIYVVDTASTIYRVYQDYQ